MSLKYLLDTNIISELMRPIPNSKVIERANLERDSIATASLVIHELLYGCWRMPESKKRQAFVNYIQQAVINLPIFDYGLKAAQWHAQERIRLSKVGKTPAFVDGQIASIAYCNNLILITNNVSDFEAFDDLNIENWLVS